MSNHRNIKIECINKSSESVAPASSSSDSSPPISGPLSILVSSVSSTLPDNIKSDSPSLLLEQKPSSYLVQNSSKYRKYSVFRSSRYSTIGLAERSLLPPVLPIKTPIEDTKPLVLRRLLYLHTGRCTERLTQNDPTMYSCNFPDIHTFKDMVHPDRPVVQYIKYNRVINICGLNNIDSDPSSKMLKCIHSMGVKRYEAKLVCGDQNMNSFEKRKRTFASCNVMSTGNINALSEAGFYYIGDGNTEETKCFFCGQRVLYWGNSVKPWTTHAIISKDCHYIALCKGKYYVNKVYNNYQHIQNFCETNYFEQLIDIKYDEDSFNELNTTPNYSDSENETIFGLKLCTKISEQPLTERLFTRTQIKNKNEEVLQCKICFKNIMNVLFIPCGHIIACIQCSLILKHCPLCVQVFNDNTYFLRVFIVIIDEDNNKKEKENEDLIIIHENFVEKSKVKLLLCKICQKNAMVAYIPCRHLYSCSNCTLTLHNTCPICSVDMIGMIQTSIMSQ